jgi:phage gp37-like protein
MIAEIQSAIITELSAIDGVGTVGVWQGDIDDLLQSPQRLPALHVIYQGAKFEDKKIIGVNRADHQMKFNIILIARNAKSREEGASGAYTIIEAVRGCLLGCQILPYGWLWPEDEELIDAVGGMLIYGLIYHIKTAVISGS